MQLRPYPSSSKKTGGGGDPSTSGMTDNAKKKIAMLQSMGTQTGSKDAIADSIAVYNATGEISDAEARYMCKYFGIDPDEWME